MTWRNVPGWPGFAVTDCGEIRGPSGATLRPMVTDGGHLYVTSGTRSRKLYVHRAVLLAFEGPAPAGREARHKNGRPADNRLSNLAWGTRLEQRADDRRHGVQRGRPKALTAESAQAVRALKGARPSRDVGAEFGVSHTAVLQIWRGKAWAHVR